MFRQFKFEEALYPKLEEIPISAMFKLETLGLDFPLEAWRRLALEERWVLCHMPMRSRGERDCYRDYVFYLLKRQKVPLPVLPTSPAAVKKPWEELSRLPAEVAKRAGELNLPLFWPDWIKLDDMERYAIYRSCAGKSGNAQVQKVVEEFMGLSHASPSQNR